MDDLIGYAVVKFMKYITQSVQVFTEIVAQYGQPNILLTDNET